MKKQSGQTTLPTYQEEMRSIKASLLDGGALALLFIDASKIDQIEQGFGKEIFGKVLKELTDIILNLKGEEIRTNDLITLYGVEGEQFLVFLSRKRETRQFHTSDLEGLVDRIANLINSKLAKTVYVYQKTRPRVSVGHAIIIYNPLIQEERQIYKLIDDAKTMSQYQQLRNNMRNKEKVQELLIKEEIKTHFQAIVRLSDFEILGYEALSRGPAGSEYEFPYALFSMASEVDLIFELDRLCRRKAILNSSRMDEKHRLFLNCLPAAIHDPDFKGDALEAILQKAHLKPDRIVIEISERDAIENYPLFRSAVEYYTNMGFSIAVDDTGAGYSSLETVVELKPEYLKLDISLVRQIDQKPVKQELLKAILTLARFIKATVIAEGIETRQELDTLTSLGVPFGQGYLIARPSLEFISPFKS